MPLSDKQLAELERFGPENVRVRLATQTTGSNSTVAGLGDGMMVRRDVEDWLYEHDKKSATLQLDILWWAKVGALAGILGILTAVIIAVLHL
jgi:hypothetical protein